MNREYKIAFFDVDGTLRVIDKHYVPESAVRAIDKLKQMGIKVIICSGRNYDQMPDYVKAIGFDYYICYNGALITDGEGIFPPLILAQLAEVGFETVPGPSVLAANIAMGAATLAVALRCKNQKNKEIGISTGVTALCGITEPALYGVIFKFKKPLIAVMSGGAVGGMFAGIVGLKRYVPSNPGLPSLGVFIGADPMNIIWALITVVIAFVVAFVVAWFLCPGIDANTVEK